MFDMCIVSLVTSYIPTWRYGGPVTIVYSHTEADSVSHLLQDCYVSYKIRNSQGHTIYSRIMLYQVPRKF